MKTVSESAVKDQRRRLKMKEDRWFIGEEKTRKTGRL